MMAIPFFQHSPFSSDASLSHILLVPALIFHTHSTKNRKTLLSEIVGDGSPVPKTCGRIAEQWINKISEKYPDAVIEKYVIMPDHIHLLLLIAQTSGTGNPSPTLGKIIVWFKYQVTKEINSLNNTQGERVFQRFYYDHVNRNQRDYAEIIEYIENNPRKFIIDRSDSKDIL